MKKWLCIILGTLFMALGLNLFLAPCNIVTGGATGIALIILRIFGIPMWLTSILLNIPLLAIAIKIRGLKFTENTLYATLLLSFFIGITEYFTPFDTDIFISSIFGGILSGVGLGLVFRQNTTTGGSDLASNIIKYYFPHIALSKIMLAIDVIVILLGLFALGITPALYSIVSVYVISKTIDVVLEGLSFAKAVYIISDKAEEIGNYITQNIKRGATLIDCTGMYTHNHKYMLIVVISSKQINKLKDITHSIDSKSFVFISDVREIMGDFAKK